MPNSTRTTGVVRSTLLVRGASSAGGLGAGSVSVDDSISTVPMQYTTAPANMPAAGTVAAEIAMTAAGPTMKAMSSRMFSYAYAVASGGVSSPSFPELIRCVQRARTRACAFGRKLISGAAR